jgi:hypothetical protein
MTPQDLQELERVQFE